MTKTRDLADLGGGFIQAGTGAVQRSVESKLQDALNIKDFGAVGNGTTDDSAAFQAAVNALTAAVGVKGARSLHIPAGVYLIGTKVTAELQASGAWQSAEIFGDGSFSTVLLAAEANSDGVLLLSSPGNSERWQVSGIAFGSSLSSTDTGNNGTALEIRSTLGPTGAGWGDAAKYSTMLEDVHIVAYGDTVPENNSTSGYFAKGIKIENKWYPHLRNVTAFRGSGRDAHASGSVAIEFVNCYSPIAVNYYIAGQFETGIKYIDGMTSGGLEDFRFNEGFIVGSRYGIHIDHTEDTDTQLYEPGGLISNNHIAARQTAIYIRCHREVVISNNYLYTSSETTPGTGGPFGAALYPLIHLDSTGDILIDGNQFLEPGFYLSDAHATVGILLEGRTQGLLAQSNIFNMSGIGLALKYDSDLVSGVDRYPPVFKDNLVNNGAGTWSLNKLQIDTSTGKNAHIHWIQGYGASTYVSKPYQTDKLTEEFYYTQDSAGTDFSSHALTRTVSNNTAGAQDTEWKFWNRSNGSLVTTLQLGETGARLAAGKVFSIGSANGATGTFTTTDGKTITVNGGIIIGIV